MLATSIEMLLKEIQELNPFDETEKMHREAILSWLKSPAPLARSQFDPGHAVGSALIVSPKSNSLCLIFHSRLHRWLQPGGHAESGDLNLRDTAAREAREELGVLISAPTLRLFDLDVHAIPSTSTEPQHLHFDIRYLGVVAPTQLHAASDARRAQWFSPKATQSLELDSGLRRMIIKCIVGGILIDA